MRFTTTFLRISVFFVLSVAMSMNALATTYYVHGGGNDGNSGMSASQAFRTINKAVETAGDGDVISIGAGSYNESIEIMGVRGAGLEFRAESPGDVTLGGQVEVFFSNRVVFKNFRFVGSAERFIVWHGSYDGLLQGCTFSQGRQGLLVKDGSLTLDGCQISNFTNHGIQVDGDAQLTIQNSHISGCGGSGVQLRKDSRVTISDSNIIDNAGDGLQVAVTEDLIPVNVPSCDCLGTSPQEIAQVAYDLLSGVHPTYLEFQNLITSARADIYNALNPSLWTDEWHARGLAEGTRIYDDIQSAIDKLNTVYTNDVEFAIHDDEVIVDHPFTIDVEVLGAAISYGTYYDAPVTTNIRVGSTTYEPFGPFSSPTQGNVNDGQNPRQFDDPEVHPPSSKITMAGRSWLKYSTSSSGTSNSDWYSYLTVQSTNSANLEVLRNGADVPNLNGANGQASAASFLTPYIDSNDKITLDANQVIFLFELGTTNLQSTAADFQDLVVLLTLKRVASTTELTQEESDLVRQAMQKLVEASQVLAQCAINEVACAGGDAALLAEAMDYHDTGLSHAGNERFAEAAAAFELSWDAAQRASAVGSSNTVPRNRPDPPPGWNPVVHLDVLVTNSIFTGNRSGVTMLTKHKFNASGSDFSENSNCGLQLRGEVSLSNCTIESNGVTGVWLEDAKSPKVSVNNLSVKDNVKQGLFIKNSVLTLGASDLLQWSISGSETVITGQDSDLTFHNISIGDAVTAALDVSGGKTKATNSTFSNSGVGISATQTELDINDCTLSGNTVGLRATQSPVKIRGVVGQDNVTAIALDHHTIDVQDADLFENSESGLDLEQCEGVVKNCSLHNNGSYGIKTVGPNHPLFDDIASTDNTYGIGTWYGSVTLRKSQFDANADGIFAYQTQLVIDDTAVEENTSHGYYIGQSTLEFVNQTAQIVNNFAGIRVEGWNDYPNLDEITLNGIRIANNTNYGVIKDGCHLLLEDCVIEDNGHYGVDSSHSGNVTFKNSTVTGQTLGVFHHTAYVVDNQAVQVQITVEDSTFSNGTSGISGDHTLVALRNSTFSNFSGTGVSASGGTHTVEDSTFTNCEIGFSANLVDSFVARRSQFTETPASGASLILQYKDGGTATLEDCTLRDSQGTALGIYRLNNQDDLILQNTKIQNNGAGLGLSDCRLTFDQSDQQKWAGTTENTRTINASGGDLTFDGFTLSGAKQMGIYAEGSALTFNNSVVTGNGDNGVVAVRPSHFTASNTIFKDEYVALEVHRELQSNPRPAEDQSPVSINDCTFSNNVYSLSLTHVTDNSFELKNTSIVDSSRGLILSTSDLLMDQVLDGWTIARNGLSISASASNLVIQNASIDDSEVGIENLQGSLALRDSLIEAGDMGVISLDHSSLNIDRCLIKKGSNDGNWLSFYQQHHGLTNADQESGLLSRGTGNVRNTVIAGFDKGVHAESNSFVPLYVLNATLAECNQTGIDVLSGAAVVKNTIIAGSKTAGSVAIKLSSGSLTHSYNLVHGFGTPYQGTTEGEGDVFNNPRFATGTFALAKGSPAINAGTDLTALGIDSDLLGNSRPSFKVFEIGAYEFTDSDGSFRILNWQEKR